MSLLTLNKKKFLELRDKKSYYRLSLESILYLTRDSVERKTIVYTDNNAHTINRSLKDIENYLDDRFVKTHRSCVINRDRIAEINYRTREIIFDNGSKIDFLSKKYKLEVL